MKIENLADLINGKIQNNPAISSVESFTFSLKNLRQKMAFISFDNDEELIQNAINRGAYVVIYEKDIKINDNEIAYIKVDDLQKSLFRLMRFYCGLNELKFFVTQNLIFDIAKTCMGDFRLLRDDLKSQFLQIINSKNGEIFISNDKNFIEKFFIVSGEILPNFNQISNNSSIFYSNLFIKDRFQNVIFPEIFIKEISGLINFFKDKNINFEFVKLQNFSHFAPIFINKFMQIKEFGASYKAFICENDKEIFQKSSEFLNHKFKQGIITLAPVNSNVEANCYFHNLKEILNYEEFHYALIFCEKKDLIEILEQKKDFQKKLF